MKDTIDWKATQDTREGWDATDLLDHWRSLAYQEHAARLRAEWMLDRHLALNSAYPKVMKEKLADEYAAREAPTSSPQPRAWPFR
jgi:hypothetical protein